jgi:hypothetical protein
MFEEMWLKHEGYDDMVTEAWEPNDEGAAGVASRWKLLHEMSKDMKKWSIETFGSVRAEIKRLKTKLDKARSDTCFSGYSQAIRDIEQQLHDVYEKEEVMYRQRSRQEWLKAGDRNTKFFQNRASHRKRKNTVLGLIREDGSVCKTNEGMAEMALAFYHNLYASEGSSDREQILPLISQMVTTDMNQKLTATLSDAEIEEALFQMGPTKSPGPDGLPALFYQRHRSFLKEHVCRTVRDFLAGVECPADFNDTILVLIPKVSSPNMLIPFRPISLCNMLYKIAAKAMATRLKKILPVIECLCAEQVDYG